MARKEGIRDLSLENFVDGKSVAVVGNASSLFDNSFGKEIDAHDVVIRFNKAAPLWIDDFKETHGEKFDVWAFWAIGAFYREVIEKEDPSSRITQVFNNEKHIKKIQLFRSIYAKEVSTNHEFDTLQIRHFKNLQKRLVHCKTYVGREDTRKQLRLLNEKGVKMGTLQPSAGVGILFWLRLCQPKSVTIYGMDFKKTPTFSENDLYERDMIGRVDARCKHNFVIEEQYVKKEVLTDKRFQYK